VNDSGVTVGQAYNKQFSTTRAFVYNGTSTVDIGDLGGGQASALSINNAGKVVGYAVNGDGYDRAFVYEDGNMFDLGTLGGNYSYANGINDSNQIVGGAFVDASDHVFHAFLYEQGTMTDLNTLLSPSAANWVLNEAKSISNNGQIVGLGTNSGVKHMFLLTPALPPLLGDANGDDKVDFADFQIVERNFGLAGDFSAGDFSGDGLVDHLDFNILHEHFGDVRTAGGAAEGSTVPEPGGFGLLAIAALVLRRQRRMV
jgi:MYXO-CTERM domain-containing protein